MVLEKLVPGQVVDFDNQSCVFVAKLANSVGKQFFLFHNGMTFEVENADLLKDTGVCVNAQPLFQTAQDILSSHKMLIGENFERIYPGMVVLDVNLASCNIRKIAVVDQPHKLAFDKDGQILNVWSNLVFDTGCKVDLVGLLTEEGRRSIEMMYPE